MNRRGERLAELADAINELTDIRHSVQIYEIETGSGTKRKRVRRRHIETHPSLLDALTQAMRPGADDDAGTTGFESRPPAKLGPVAVRKAIAEESLTWARAFGIRKTTLAGRLHSLVGASHTDTQLENLTREAQQWVRQAKIATGWEAMPFTLNQPCPSCWRKNSLVVTGDLASAFCTRCGVDWPENLIGLLGQQLVANAEHETLALTRCTSSRDGRGCQAPAGHDGVHRDAVGHYWTDESACSTCA